MKRAGIIVITIGFALAVFSSATYFREDLQVKLGRLEHKKLSLNDPGISPLIGMGIMLIGAYLVWRDRHLTRKAGINNPSKTTEK